MQYEDFPTLRQSLEDAKPGSFVEFEATLRKNPLIETLEDITSMYNMFVSPETTPTTNIPATAQKRSKTSNTSNQKQNESERTLSQMQILLSQLNAQQTTDLVGTIVGQESTKAVLVIDRAFLNDRSMADLVDGQYTILGKIVRTIPKESDASINLLRNTPLGKLSGSVIAQLANGLAAATEAGLNFPKFELELSGPVIQVIPIAIFI